MKLKLLAASAALALLVGASAASAADFDFSTPVTTSPTDSGPGVWYTDRYAPATFQSQVTYGGRSNTLSEATSVADGANSRPSSYSSSFYNTQGYSLDYTAGTTSSNIDLYLDPLYADSGFADGRIAGFWGVGVDGSNAVTSYSILELDKVGGSLDLLSWDDTAGTWTTVSSGLNTGGWVNLGFALNGSNVDYLVDGSVVGSVGANGSVGYKNSILQVHNTNTGVNDFAHWSGGAAVPEPASWAMMLLGFGGIGGLIRRRRTQLRELYVPAA